MEDAWGIVDGYWDVAGAWRPTSTDTRDRLRAAMGVPTSEWGHNSLQTSKTIKEVLA